VPALLERAKTKGDRKIEASAMVLKWVIWRLQTESWPPLKGRVRRRKVLVLRDRKGHVRAVARTEFEKKKLTDYYHRHFASQRLEKALAGQRVKEHVRKLKQRVRRQGFRYQMSVWGTGRNKETREKFYRRYEVFKADQWTPFEFGRIHKILNEHHLKSNAGVLVLHNNKLYAVKGDELISNDGNKS
jgi:hypothetical protein